MFRQIEARQLEVAVGDRFVKPAVTLVAKLKRFRIVIHRQPDAEFPKDLEDDQGQACIRHVRKLAVKGDVLFFHGLSGGRPLTHGVNARLEFGKLVFAPAEDGLLDAKFFQYLAHANDFDHVFVAKEEPHRQLRQEIADVKGPQNRPRAQARC